MSAEDFADKTLARRLDEAFEGGRSIRPLSESDGISDADRAYAVQRRWTELRLGRGEREIGHKIGLTSRAMQEQLGVNEPDYGSLWESRYFPASSGSAEFPFERFLQPRVEGELAFLIERPLTGGNVTADDVMAATAALAVAIEVIDSRIDDWRIKLADTIADNASYGALTLGPWSASLRACELRTLGMLVEHNGTVAVEAIGAAALGNPARAVAWLANRLASYGVGLEEGEIVLSGALGRSLAVERGDTVVVETHGQPPLTAIFA
jgi:2-keto-4-pentenoate hydratase